MPAPVDKRIPIENSKFKLANDPHKFVEKGNADTIAIEKYPHVQDEPSDGLPSAEEETDVENVIEESDYENVKNGTNGKEESVSDSAIIEKEEGIYGLQIIKNSDLEELQELGSGTYGTVYYGKWRGTDIAIKRIKQSCFAGSSSEQERLVGDFGLSRIKRNTLVSGGVRGTLPWMAPELLNGNSSRVSEKVDVFSFGITVWEILTGEKPYANLHCGAIIGITLVDEAKVLLDHSLILTLTTDQVTKVVDFDVVRVKAQTNVMTTWIGTYRWMDLEIPEAELKKAIGVDGDAEKDKRNQVLELKRRKNVKIEEFRTPTLVTMPHRYYLRGVGVRICARKLKFRDLEAEDFGLSPMEATYGP
ncbi:hypothetical protein T459_01997 [Capsicum annuum]|uniref:Protein kinase domain-containing protein n=1 Tax=Capsicum annuum TaxID=4072 RepID=A0A2G3AIP7_CAPAN|nr:hypothetical protein T459_01997 [Capsicum annuum]